MAKQSVAFSVVNVMTKQIVFTGTAKQCQDWCDSGEPDKTIHVIQQNKFPMQDYEFATFQEIAYKHTVVDKTKKTNLGDLLTVFEGTREDCREFMTKQPNPTDFGMEPYYTLAERWY